jgi:hypothetical protein
LTAWRLLAALYLKPVIGLRRFAERRFSTYHRTVIGRS